MHLSNCQNVDLYSALVFSRPVYSDIVPFVSWFWFCLVLACNIEILIPGIWFNAYIWRLFCLPSYTSYLWYPGFWHLLWINNDFCIHSGLHLVPSPSITASVFLTIILVCVLYCNFSLCLSEYSVLHSVLNLWTILTITSQNNASSFLF